MGITLEFQKNIAIVTLDKPSNLNALSSDEFFLLAKLLRDVAVRPDVDITVVTGTGRLFSA
jgi:Delta3-Delta2-enoyl-CoA isomerase